MTLPSNRLSTPSTNLILQAVSEIKAMLTSLDDRVRTLEQSMIAQNITAMQKLEAVFRRVDEHSQCIRELQDNLADRVTERRVVTDDLGKRMERVEAVASAAKWLGGIVGTLILGLIWLIITRQISIP